MLALLLCLVALVCCYWATRRSIGAGLVTLLVFGYFYGILRANLLTTAAHFIFDAGVLGLYLAVWGHRSDTREAKRWETMRWWVFFLIAWPTLLVFMPFQPFLVSIVGLRGNIYFLPLLLIGSRLKQADVVKIATGLAVLDLIAVAFGGAEYFLGVPRFYPVSPVTQIIYASGDVEGGFYRIPAIFINAHAFGGTMVASIPFLIGLWTNARHGGLRLLALITMPVAMLGVLLSATRTNFVMGCAMVAFFIFTTKLKNKHRFLFALIIAGLAFSALSNVRFQRFKSLSDTDYVSDRVAGSVNRSFLEILMEYPMGNGLGGGGTSLPYFLEGEVRNPIGMENEYARILCEQGIVGLLIWLAFLVWFVLQFRTAFAPGFWTIPRKLLWGLCSIGFGTAWIGVGILTSVPGTLLLMIGMGWVVISAEAREAALAQGLPRRPQPLRGSYVPALR